MNRMGEIASAAIDQELAGLVDGRRKKEELDRLRADLARFLEPLRVGPQYRQGQYHEFLDRTAGILIDGLVGRAQANARKSVVGCTRGAWQRVLGNSEGGCRAGRCVQWQAQDRPSR